METFDFFIAHAGADIARAEALQTYLIPQEVRVYLDRHELRVGSLWPIELKNALMASRVTVVLISSHSDDSFYQQEEVAIAIRLLLSESIAHHIIPVFLVGSKPEHAPYGLAQMHALFEEKLGMLGVAKELVSALARLPLRPAVESLGNSIRLLDQLWDTAEGMYVDSPIPRQHRAKYEVRKGTMVHLEHGRELERITRDEFEQKLTAQQLDEVKVLEKAMEINLAVWDEAHPKRVLDPAQRRLDEDAVAAMAEDLCRVLRLVQQAGFWLDDHYDRIYRIVEPLSGNE